MRGKIFISVYIFGFFLFIICFHLFSTLSFAIQSTTTPKDLYKKKIGNIRFSTLSISFGRVRNNEVVNDTLWMINSGSKIIHIYPPSEIPAYLNIEFGKSILQAGEKSWIAIKYDASKLKDYGYVFDTYSFQSDDPSLPLKTFQISAVIIDYFPPMNGEDSISAPKVVVDTNRFDYGRIKEGEKIIHNFIIRNDGQQDLLIRKVKSNTVSITVQPSKNIIAPGESVELRTEFDSSGKIGKDARRIYVYLNDPLLPELVLEIQGEIYK